MTGTISIASTPVVGSYAQHLYLIYDPNSDGDNDSTTGDGVEIIRGGPENSIFTTEWWSNGGVFGGFQQVIIEPGFAEADSDNAYGTDDMTDRNVTSIVSSSSDSVWQDMVNFSETLGITNSNGFVETSFDYDPVGTNSNSVINTVLNVIGINFRDVAPVSTQPDDFPGHMHLLDGSGSTLFTAYQYTSNVNETTFFHKNNGNDTILLEWNNSTSEHAKLHIYNENDSTGLTEVYLDNLDFDDVTFGKAGDDLTISKLTEELVRVEDYYDDHTNEAVDGENTTAFEFEDFYALIGDDNANEFDALGQTKKVVIDGAGGDDNILGWEGNDRLYGGDGNDYIVGETGRDDIYGGDGDDTLIGSSFYNEIIDTTDIVTRYDDKVYFGKGNDIAIAYNSGYYAEHNGGINIYADTSEISSSSGGHRINVSGYDISDINASLYKGNYVIWFDDTNSYTAVVSTSDFISRVDVDDGFLNVTAYTDPIPTALETELDAYFDQTSGNDTFSGSNGTDILHGWDGDDTISGLDGDDYIRGGAGDDTIFGNDGDDLIFDNDGDNVIWGGNGNDGILVRTASASAQTVHGGAGDDSIFAIVQQDQATTLYGGIGNDTIRTAQHVQAYGGADSDVIYHSGAFTLANGIADGGDGDDLILTRDEVKVIGGAGDDVLNPYSLSQIGDHTVYLYESGHGNDIIFDIGGSQDKIYFGTGITQTSLSYKRFAGTDDLEISIGVNGSIYIERQYGDFYGKDTDIERIVLDSGAGTVINLNNVVVTNWGGSSGEDIFYSTSLDETFDGGDGNDTVDYSANTQAVHIDLLNGIYDQDGDMLSDDSFTSIENITGSSYDDYLRGHNQFSSVIKGGDGNDEIWGQADSDELHGGNGNDTITGNGGDDLIYGDAGTDTLTGSGGHDTIYGGADNDTIKGKAGNDILYGDAGVDFIQGFEDNDVLYGGTENDYLYGDAGDDILHGDEGNDRLFGRDDDDTIYGGDGNDTIFGEDGLDTLYGGNGADIFTFNGVSAFNDVDVIKDFDTSEYDKIDLSDVLSLYDPLNDAITDFVQITDNGTDSTISIDSDGGANNFVSIALVEGVTGLTDETALESSGTLITA